VEDMSDPLQAATSNTMLQTNIIANVLYWNVMGCLFSLFVFLFDGVLRMGSGDDGAGTVSIMGYSSFGPMNRLLLVGVFVLLIGWNMFIPFAFVSPAYGIALLLMSLTFLVFSMYLVNEEMKDTSAVNSYPVRKRIVFWVGFAMTVPLVAISMDMLLQRRDWLLNWTVFFSVVVVGLCSLGIEMVQTSFEYASMHAVNSRRSMDPTTLEDKKRIITQTDIYQGRKLQDFCDSKNMVIRVILISTGLLILTACVATFPSFPATPFSNSYTTVIVVAFVLTLPLISLGRHLTEVGCVRV
jgi:hypothetical protein